MKIAIPREHWPGETRVALVPESVKKLTQQGLTITVEKGAGLRAGFSDEAYQKAGATIEADPAALWGNADFIATVQPPVRHPDLGKHEAELPKPGAVILGSLRPTQNLDAIKILAQRKVTAFSTDAIPRITRAQAMDTLSSMSNIAGYKAVLLAADQLDKYFPMLMTAAGTVLPANVFIIGAGVAGLQAIATAKRLGAKVEATDTRPVVREQIESLGAKWVGVESAELAAAQDAGGYAKQLSEDFYRKQRELLAQRCAAADVVITTALIGGVTAPKLITADMVRGMRPGAVIVDLAAEGGGNCELTKPGETVIENGVKILAPLNLPAQMPLHASTLYSRNITNFVLEFWKNGAFNFDPNDEIVKGAVITRDGEILHGPTKAKLQPTAA